MGHKSCTIGALSTIANSASIIATATRDKNTAARLATWPTSHSLHPGCGALAAEQKVGRSQGPAQVMPDALFVNGVETLLGIKSDCLDRFPFAMGVPGKDTALIQIGGFQLKASLVTASSILQSEIERRSRTQGARPGALAAWQARV